VYKARIGSKTVAVKVQRPGIRNVMERDLALLRTLANWVESIPAPDFIQKQHEHKLVGNRLIAAELEDSVEEFFSRIFE
jgi:predicted unusual protein kinase regulating ubiquinone biosynthesis (AarF/ABC1/UbiB family)